MENFNDFRFNGLDYESYSNKYFTMNRISKDENKIVVKVANEHLIKTIFGYALILDENNVVFLKNWQVSENYFGNEVLLTRQYFNVKEWGKHTDFFGINKNNHNFDTWLKIAKEQQKAENIVKWEK